MKKEERGAELIKWLLRCMFLSVCIYFVLGEKFFPIESTGTDYNCKEFIAEWEWIKPDGTRVSIDLPCKCEAKRGETVVIETVLPTDIEENMYLCFRSSRQDIFLYVDDALRQEYSTEKTRPYGRTSAAAYVFLKLDREDAGKILTMVTRSDSSYSGVFLTPYYGDKMGIWRYFFKQHGGELMIAVLMLIFGLLSVAASMAVRLCYHKKAELEYLGWGVCFAAIWLVSNSAFRQLLFPNISMISDMPFYMIMLMPIPFMIYMNELQTDRYYPAYLFMETVGMADFVVCTALHATNCVDFADSFSFMAVICVLSILLMGVTIVKDIRKGHIREYLLPAIGVLGACLAAVAQIVLYLQRTIPFDGVLLSVGLLFLLLVSAGKTIRDFLNMEKERQQAIASSEMKAKFLANMSHEIRTPINAVLGMDAMILRECKDMQIKGYALDIQNAGQSLLSLINDILDLSKIESGKMEIIPAEYDFSSMIHDVSNMISMKARDKDLIMNVSVDRTLPSRVYGDEIRIRQILINILNNAVKYTNEGSVSLTVIGTVEGDEVILFFSVEDTGIGIKEEDLSKLFAEFERIEEKRNRNVEGTGLGMNITAQLLELMGSKLDVQSVYGKGSKFSFKLRQKIINAEPIGDLEKRIREQTQEFTYDVSFTAPEAKLLVVDDNATNRRVFVNLLKETKVKIDEAASGQECLELINENYYDIIFLDHMMPEMDGVETLHRMRAQTDYPCKDTPVVSLTANAVSGAKEMYLSEGFEYFLSKPIIPDKLEKLIRQILPKELLIYEQKAAKNSASESNQEQPDTADLPEIDGLDWNYGLMHLPDIKLLLDTVLDFYKMIDSEADYLENCYRELFENSDDTRTSESENADAAHTLELYRVKVHAMKSSAAMIGAVPISGIAKMLEYAAKDGKLDVIQNVTPAFLEEWRSYKGRLKVCVPEEGEKETPKDYGVILTLLEMLRIAMDDMDVDVADETIAQIKKYHYPTDVLALTEQLDAAVTNLDSDRTALLTEEISNLIKHAE